MIKFESITHPRTDECISCKGKEDLKNLRVGLNEHSTYSLTLCVNCRAELNRLTAEDT